MKADSIFGLVGFLSLLVGLFGCGEEGPTDSPVVTGDSAPEYVFIANPQTRDQFWRYSFETNTLDTIYFDTQTSVYCLAESTIRRELYAAEWNDPYVQVFDMDSGTKTGQFAPHPLLQSMVEMLASPDGQWLAAWDQRTTVILNLSDKSVVYWDSSYALEPRMWSGDSRRLYQIAYQSGLFYSVIDLDIGPARRLLGDIHVQSWFSRMAASPDESTLYSIELVQEVPQFLVYNIALDSVIFRYLMTSPYGDIAVSPDGSRVFFTSPKPNYPIVVGVTPPSPYIYEYDVASNSISRAINIDHFVSEAVFPPIDMQQLWMSPDGSHLIAASQHEGAYFADYSLATDQLLFGHNFSPWWNSWLLSQ